MSDVKYRSSMRVKNAINHIGISLSSLAEETLYTMGKAIADPKTIES